MGRYLEAPHTLAYLGSQPLGADIYDIASHYGVTVAGARSRIRAARHFLQDHPDIGMAIPRPIGEHDWRYRLIGEILTDVGGDIRDGAMADNTSTLGLLNRLGFETEVALEHNIGLHGRRHSVSRKLSARVGHINALVESIQTDQATLHSLG